MRNMTKSRCLEMLRHPIYTNDPWIPPNEELVQTSIIEVSMSRVG